MLRDRNLKAYVTISLMTVFGMQSLRLLLPLFQQYLGDTVGIPYLNLAPIALGIFLLTFLAAPLARRFGFGGMLGITVMALPLLRLLEQLNRNAALDLVISAAIVILYWWFLTYTFSLGSGTRVFATALLFGIAVDTALHAAAGTLALSWQQGFAVLGLVFLLGGLISTFGAPWLEASASNKRAAPRGRSPWSVFALGIWLLLQMLVFQNVGRLASFSGMSLPVSGALIVSGNALALLTLRFFPLRRKHLGWLSGALLTGLMLLPSLPGAAAVLWVFAGQVLMAAWFLVLCATPPTRAAGRSGYRSSLGSAALAFVIAALVYYVSYDLPLGLRGDEFLPVFAGLLLLGGIAGLRTPDDQPTTARSYRPALAAAILLVLPLGYWLSWDRPAAVQPEPGNQGARVLTYNVHQAFNTRGQLNVEALAQLIEESGADIIGLQEVPRGYLTAGSLDLVSWLSERLGMPYVFGPAIDTQWGNALLSRYPIVEAVNVPLPPDDLLLLRSYIRATIDIGDGELTVFVTHLHHRPGEGDIRAEQIAALLAGWDGVPNTLILGDLNATPDSPEIGLLFKAGLMNASAVAETPVFTYPSEDADREIDYIWSTADLIASDYVIYQTTASDHLPVAVTLTQR